MDPTIMLRYTFPIHIISTQPLPKPHGLHLPVKEEKNYISMELYKIIPK